MAVKAVEQGATIADLRRRIAAVNPRGTRAAPEPTRPPQHDTAPTRLALALPEHLQPAFPTAGLPQGSMVELCGARGPAVSIIATVTRAGGSVAIIDTPTFGLLAAHEQGADLTRIALVPDSGDDPIAVISVLTEGMDLIVWTPGRTTCTPSVERGLAARLRTKQSTLIALGPGLRRPDYRLEVNIANYRGITTGHGNLSGIETTIRSSGRNLAPTRTRVCLSRGDRILKASVVPADVHTLGERRRQAGT